MLHHGIDLHKHSIVIGTVDDQGTLLAQKRLPTRRTEILQYFESRPGPHRATVEATSSWYWLAELFDQHGIELTLAHAKALKAITYAKVKTDAVDAATLAQLLRADLIPVAHMLHPELRPYRDLLRQRLGLVYQRSACKCSIETLLEKYNQPSPDQLPHLASFQASQHQEQIELLTRQIRELEKILQQVLLPLPPVQRLLYIPGVGRLSAFTVFLETGDPHRFSSDRHYVSYCRLVPGAKNSAGRTRQRPSKDGNRYLKNAFRNAAVRAIQYEPTIKAWYLRLLRKKNKPIAQTLVAKELARIAFRLLVDEVDFNGTFKGVPIEKPKEPRWPRRASPDA
jgi:transposase